LPIKERKEIKSLFKFQKNKTAFLLNLKILLLVSCTCNSAAQTLVSCIGPVCHYQMIDSMFNSPQNINLLFIEKESPLNCHLHIAGQSSSLYTTSQYAENHEAIAAVNGSFFDMDKGGSVTYFEKNDSVISRTRSPGQRWAVADSIINGAIILGKEQTLKIEYANADQFYEKSDKEAFVMVSGPLLIKDSIPQRLPDMSFTYRRHPRTSVGITRESIIFITIDGRSEQSAGMSLYETQEYLLGLGCTDALNLDGGGSTSMWIKEKGIVNIPSDTTGERPVANALLILKK